MIDEDFKVYLIEVNTNPCLDVNSTLQARLIPNLIDNILKYYDIIFSIAIDPIYLPPDINRWPSTKKDNIPENLEITNKFD